MARNCRVAHGTIVRIADFQFAAQLQHGAVTRYLPVSGRLAVRWMALESLESSVFSAKSDVVRRPRRAARGHRSDRAPLTLPPGALLQWSLGVVLWELLSNCALLPYNEIETTSVVDLLRDGRRLDRPSETCPPEAYYLMVRCWDPNPSRRPTVTEVKTQLQQMTLAALPAGTRTVRDLTKLLHDAHSDRRR